MNASTSTDIATLPFTRKELAHTSRNRSGFHLFISIFFSDFKERSDVEKEELLRDASIWDGDTFEVNPSSLLSPPTPTVVDIMRLGCKRWRSASKEVKNAWRNRAVALNALPIPGRFCAMPVAINVNADITESMTLDWMEFSRCFHMSIVKTRANADRSYKFGTETVRLGNMIYRSSYLNHLLQICLFGHSGSLLQSYELVDVSKKMKLIHLHSLSRLKEIFTLEGLCAIKKEVYSSNDGGVLTYACCGKVNLKDHRGNSVTGYVVMETASHWTIQIDLNTFLNVKRVFFDIEVGSYIYDKNPATSGEYIVTEYNPCRFKILASGKLYYLINRILLDNNDKLVQI